MYQNEENRLQEHKQKYDEIEIPSDRLDQSISKGMSRAHMESTKSIRKIGRWIVPMIAASILVFAFIASIRVSPAFASHVASLPGMEKMVELIHHDKGLMSALENEFMQDIGVSQENDGMKLTIDSAIADEQGMVVFYSIETEQTQEELTIKKSELTLADGSELEAVTSYDTGPFLQSDGFTSKVEVMFSKLSTDTDYILNAEIEGASSSESFSIPFSIEHSEETKHVYELNQTVDIEGQSLIIERVIVYPIRTAVEIKAHPDNTKKILHFESMRLVNEDGEEWSGSSNGLTSSGDNETGWSIYLQSNYFENPDELYLEINEMQAIDKEDEFLVFDTEQRAILHQPNGNRLVFDEISNGTAFFSIADENYGFVPFGSIKDSEDKEFGMSGSYNSTGEGSTRFGFDIPKEEFTNPLYIEFEFYPAWIEDEVLIKVK
ncbi:DUF4179 domain-containing protein [Jeotgalibacillus sp. ET6]|uniref:DUF4179 domain-containing protein n=1 Tax=Jeotgalibacillus sp. ET6 TaxID=3037260 RepID=UPI0024189163|nr:DUF4179 domain-containing protein [Jeotgalibacillus sp. ET6]MDG5473251.1 DUF4179 domain-containing protein [Jeotgalibacillus sp. ET6]